MVNRSASMGEDTLWLEMPLPPSLPSTSSPSKSLPTDSVQGNDLESFQSARANVGSREGNSPDGKVKQRGKISTSYLMMYRMKLTDLRGK